VPWTRYARSVEDNGQRPCYSRSVVHPRLLACCVFTWVSFWVSFEADACSTPAAPTRVVDPSLAATDSTAPTPPTDIIATVSRRLGTRCDDDECISNSCGDSATLTLTFAPAIDDQSAADAIGYVVVSESGALPESITAMSPLPAPADQLTFRIDFDEAAELDTTAQLVAYDAAGNVSVASQPFEVRFSGCTFPPLGESCVEDEEGCNLANPSSRSSWPHLVAPSLLLGAVLIFRRAKLWFAHRA
jgi:hypothetical protein